MNIRRYFFKKSAVIAGGFSMFGLGFSSLLGYRNKKPLFKVSLAKWMAQWRQKKLLEKIRNDISNNNA
ncbi:MAG: hypothetical protein H8E08_00145 [Candidatus Marinimicrobia bacterium]|nr:hypothetical protein [Candidatus Neomarinimicrobiota bacterium]